MTCLPAWHPKLRAVLARDVKVPSGCPVDGSGNIPCRPDTLRAKAEALLVGRGLWRGALSLDAYSLGRNIATEVGAGTTPEEMVALAEASVNQAKRRGKSVSALILTASSGNAGWYGPIHGPSGVGSAPYGRWTASSKDPTLATLTVADFVLRGESGNFTHGADDQLGLEYFDDPVGLMQRHATNGQYWVGPLPGVDPWRITLFRTMKSVKPTSLVGAPLLVRGVALARAGHQKPPPVDSLPVCASSGGFVAALAVGTAMVGGALWWRRRHGPLPLPR